jgi:hypothetical protein
VIGCQSPVASIHLSEPGHADPVLAIPAGTGRRAGLLAAARLAAPAAEAASTLLTTRLDRQLHIHAAPEAAITGVAAV